MRARALKILIGQKQSYRKNIIQIITLMVNKTNSCYKAGYISPSMQVIGVVTTNTICGSTSIESFGNVNSIDSESWDDSF